MSEDLRFPIGKYEKVSEPNHEQLNRFIAEIAALPSLINEAVADLENDQIDTPYRPDGWTIRQVVHHVPESHMNAFIRFKWALTEENPTIKPYFEERWSELEDSKLPLDHSLDLIGSLHQRWVDLLETMSDIEFARTLNHPESGQWKLSEMTGLYAWHGKHHAAHITKLRERNGW